MTIQIPNPGTGNGATGDNEFVLWSKVKSNFEDQTNAASKLIGVANGQVPTAEQVHQAAFSRTSGDSSAAPITYADGSVHFVNGSSTPDTPQGFGTFRWLVTTKYNGTNKSYQEARGWGDLEAAHRVIASGVASEWRPLGWSVKNYNTTTAAGANAVIDSAGRIIRSTSSERYKDIIAPLSLTDETYANAMQLKPIVYRSTADADNPLHHYYSFSAEALGAYDKAFTLWRDTEIVEVTKVDESGAEYTEQETVKLEEPIAEGINLNALVAFSHAIAIKQDKLIKKLEERIKTLESK